MNRLDVQCGSARDLFFKVCHAQIRIRTVSMLILMGEVK